MVGPPSIWTYCSSALGCRALVLPAIYRRNARTRRSRCWRRGTRLGVLGSCSDVPASAPTLTCSPWAAPSARGPGRRRSPTARRSWATFATQRGSMASSARSAFATVLPGRVVDGAGAVDGRGGTDRHWRATALNLRLPDVVYRLLPVRRGVRREVPGHGALPGPHRAPAALAGGPRLRRQAGRRHRQRGDGGDAGARDGPARGARDDAAAIAKLCAVAPGPGPGCRPARRVLPAKVAYWLIRWKNVLLAMIIFQISRRQPQRMKALIRRGLKKRLPEGYDIDNHFSPRNSPWDQRLCLVPDGDLFAAIRRGRASIMTGDIDTFTETGVALSSGTELSADVIVTATGLNMLALGGMEIVVDGCQVDLGKTVSYQGVMFSGIPNLAAVTGYTNASWTLKCELICTYVCRLLQHMDAHGYRQVRPWWPQPELPTRPFIDLAAGYVRRSVNDFPRQGPTAPWRITRTTYATFGCSSTAASPTTHCISPVLVRARRSALPRECNHRPGRRRLSGGVEDSQAGQRLGGVA